MSRPWSRPVGTPYDGPAYWDYFGVKLAEGAAIPPGGNILDVGCGEGSSLIPAAQRAGPTGYVVGIDICPG
jgi:O-methyltransferase/aklanonic acid methyltransferase